MIHFFYLIGMSSSNSSVRSNPWAAAAATAARLAFVSSQNLRHLASARSAIYSILFCGLFKRLFSFAIELLGDLPQLAT